MTRLTTPTPAETAAPPAPLYEVRDLAISFASAAGERVQAVDGLHLSIHPTQTLALVGESGCGKSVTALATLQLLPCPPARIDRGRIRFGERELLGLSERQMLGVRGRDIAMIFQEPMSSLNAAASPSATRSARRCGCTKHVGRQGGSANAPWRCWRWRTSAFPGAGAPR